MNSGLVVWEFGVAAAEFDAQANAPVAERQAERFIKSLRSIGAVAFLRSGFEFHYKLTA